MSRTRGEPVRQSEEVTKLREEVARLSRELAVARGGGRIQSALGGSEQAFREIVSRLPGAAVFMLDREMRYRVAEGSLTDHLGVSREDVLGRTPRDLFDDDRATTAERNVRRALEGESGAFEQTIRGHPLWVQFAPLRDDGEQIVGALFVVTDITERKRAETALRLSEEKFAKAFQNNTAGMAVTRLHDGLYLEVNDTFEQTTGFSRGEVIGNTSPLIAWANPRDRARFVAALRAEGHVRGHEVRLLRRDGQEWTALLSAQVSEIGGETVIVSSFIDITERKRAEERLRQSEQRFKAIMEEAADAIFIHDFEGRFLDANRRACESLGYTREELLRMRVPDVERDFDFAAAQAAWSTIQPGEPVTLMGNHRRKDGSFFPVEMRLVVVEIAGERVVIGLGRDVTERQRADEALRASQERLALALQAARAGTFDWDRRCDVYLWSDELLSMYGLKREAFGGRFEDWIASLDPEDREAAAAAVQRSLETGLFELEFRIRRPDTGERRWLQGRGKVFFDDAGQPVRMVGLNIDITERRLAEEGLRHASELLDLGDAFVELDRDWRFVQVNATYEKLTRMRSSELLGRVMWDVFPESADRQSQFWREYNRCMIDRVPVQFEEYYAPLDLWTGVTAYPTSVGIAVYVRDIGDRKRTHEALRESEARLRRLYESGMIGVFYFDLDGSVTDANEMFLEMIGYTRQELEAGQILWEQLTPPVYRSRDAYAIEELRTRGVDTPYEKEFIRKDGTRVPVFLGAAMFDDARQHGISFVLDITDRKRAEEAMREANARLLEADQRKDDFLGMLSHELRNPLAPIFSSLFLLEHTDPAGEQSRRAREVLTRQVGHMSRLIDDLPDVTRIARGKIQLRRTIVDLGHVVTKICEDYRSLMEERRIAFGCPSVAPLRVLGDETRLGQVIGNLLQNAAKFTPAGGQVELTLAAEDGHAAIRVRDNGSGIDPALLTHVFEPFTQGKQTLARVEGGLGLGLALVKGLVELHGGTVSAANAAPSGGAEFTIRLPLLEQESRPDAAEPGGALERGESKRVLVVDDNLDSADLLGQLLRLFGHEVEIVYTGEDALRRAATFKPDAVLCDIGLPGMDGYEVARALRATGDPVRLIAVSGYAMPEDLERSAEAGFDAHVAKPADPARIQALLTS